MLGVESEPIRTIEAEGTVSNDYSLDEVAATLLYSGVPPGTT